MGKKDEAHKKPILTEELREELTKRVFGQGENKPDTVSAKMQRDQRSADRIDAWVNRFSDSKERGSSG